MAYTRREIVKRGATAIGAAVVARATGTAQVQTGATVRTAQTSALTIAYEETGDAQGFPVLLLHGFPDDARAYDDVVAPLAKRGYRAIVPYLRGYGATRFRDASAPRMAEQAAIGQDVIDLADALKIQRFAVAGYDWGGRAADIAAALYPDRVRAAVLIGGYTIQDVFGTPAPAAPALERALWYQYYFNTERGRVGLERNRKAICRFLWETWSPTWKFTTETYERTAASFDNPDFVNVVIHSYRHRIGNAPGEPRFLEIEKRLAQRPRITAPAITLYGASDGLRTPAAQDPNEGATFTKLVARRVVEGAGHFMPRERPDAVSSALLELLKSTS
jgi:pimeloyl-ACP methyl ester carboxylesterase